MYVFVYGSLKKNFENHFWLLSNTAKFITNALTSNKSFDLVSVRDSYPSVVKGDNKIYGEIYEIDNECLRELDYLEGYPDLYTRNEYSFDTEKGKMKALMYVMPEKTVKKYNSDIKSESPRIYRSDDYVIWGLY